MIVHQPHGKQFGMQLIEAMESGKYRQLTIMVAYAKLSGVYRLIPYIERFIKSGGEVRFVIGIDQQNTTYDALKELLKLSDKFSVFHSESIMQTYHVKCYWLKGDKETWYTIGSNNLTAGGLFSNYELSITNQVAGDEATSVNSELESIYSIYSGTSSSCSHEVDNAFLDQLLRDDYVVKEIKQRKLFARKIMQAKGSIPKKKIFGSEAFIPPSLPEEFRRTKNKDVVESSAVKQETGLSQSNPLSDTGRYELDYLIRLVPSAGARSKQVHFTVDLLDRFFCLNPGDEILVQEICSTGKVGRIEERQIVFSKANKNVKIELAGAAILNKKYPSDPNTRPVLILKRVNSNFFVYMIIMKGDDGYSAINSRLMARSGGHSLAYEVIDESIMFSLWKDCPIT